MILSSQWFQVWLAAIILLCSVSSSSVVVQALSDQDLYDCLVELDWFVAHYFDNTTVVYNDTMTTWTSQITMEVATMLNAQNSFLYELYCTQVVTPLLNQLDNSNNSSDTTETNEAEPASNQDGDNNLFEATNPGGGRRRRQRRRQTQQKEEELKRSLQTLRVNFFPPSYPVRDDVSLLYNQLGFTGNIFDRLTGPNVLADRCDTRSEANDLFQLSLAQSVYRGLQAVCDGSPPVVSAGTCAAAGAAAVTLLLSENNVHGCALHDSTYY